jgi:hypothetical protein
MLRFRIVLLLVVGVAGSAPLRAQEAPAVDELLRLLPEQPAFCLVLRDIRAHAERFSDSPFVRDFRQSPLGAALSDPKNKDSFEALDKQLRLFLGLGIQDIVYDVLGDGLVFAYWPESGKTPERGVFLARARRADTLDTLLAKLKDIGLKSGDFKRIDDRQHRGHAYLSIEDKVGKLSYCLVRERLVAITEDETLLRSLMERVGASPPVSGVSRQLAELGLQNALAVLLVNPRAFDAAIEAKAASAAEPEASFLRTLSRYWRQTNAVALSVRLESDLAVAVSLQMNPEGLPESTRRFRDQASKPSPLWRQFPEKPIVAMAGRLDAAATLQTLLEFAPQDKQKEQLAELEKNVRAALALDLWKDVLPNLGPDWGVFIAAPAADTPGWFPHMVAAVRVRSQPQQKPLDEALFESLRTLAGIIAISQSKEGKSISVKTLFRDGRQMVVLTGEKVFPPGCQPTLALKGGCLVLGSSPEAIALLKDQPETPPSETASDRIVLARLSVQEGVAYLKSQKRRAAIIDAISRAHAVSQTEVEDTLDKLVEGLGLFDQLELVQRQGSNQLHLTLHLKTVKPLKK